MSMNDDPAENRKAVHAYLSLAAHDALQRWADDNGISLTGWVEAVGRQVLEHEKRVAAEQNKRKPMELVHPLDEWVVPARKVDVERRKRTRERNRAS